MVQHRVDLRSRRRWKRAVLAMGLAGLAWSVALVQPAHAAVVAVSAGSSFSQHDWTPAAALDLAGTVRVMGHGDVQWQPVAALTVISGHEHDWRKNTDRSVWVGSGGVAFSMRERGWFLALQTGATDRTTPALSSHLQFVSSLGWQGVRVQVQLRHISNGRLGSGPNLGESMVLLGLRL